MSEIVDGRTSGQPGELWRERHMGSRHTTDGRQDKSGSPVVVQAIDMAWLLACHSGGTRAAFENLHRDFNAVSGTLRLVPQSAGPP
jgi:hypothetical protein